MRRLSILPLALLFILTLLSTTFTFLAVRSPKWATQSYYGSPASTTQGDGTTNTAASVICVSARSPFYRCGIPEVGDDGKKCVIPAESCQWYKPYGKNATSCRSPGEFGKARNQNALAHELLGGSAECQAVHYAGNLQIAASFFLTLGLLLSLALSFLAVVSGRNHEETPATAASEDEPKASRHHDHPHATRKSPLGPTVLSLLLGALFIGAFLQFLAQFFGIVGLVIKATPDGAHATNDQPDSDKNNFTGDDWVIGKGLAVYATVAWTTAVAGAVVAMAGFRGMRRRK